MDNRGKAVEGWALPTGVRCAVRTLRLLVVASLCAAAPAHAQSAADKATAASSRAYPVKPIRLIPPFPAGAPSDMVGRAIGQKLSEQLGQNLVPEN